MITILFETLLHTYCYILKMSSCRTCLTVVRELAMDISQLPKDLEELKSYSDIILFCLNIEVLPSSELNTKLCEPCYIKIIDYYKFKLLALKSDEYWRSVNNDKNIDISNDIKCENSSDDDNYESENISTVKEEMDVKDESPVDMQSDDELLSVIKKIKYEYIEEEVKENVNIKRKRLKKRLTKENEKSVCEKCGKAVWNIREHMNQHTPREARKKYKCKLCDKTFTALSGRNAHHRIKHLGLKKRCDICNKDVVCLKNHRVLMHQTEPLPFKCLLCDRSFITQSLLDMHLLIHTKDRPHKCDQCEKSFRNKTSMLLHTRQVHEKEKTHLCQFCSKGFFKKYHLQVHLRSHSKERPYKCDECGKYYSSCSTLKHHKQLHTGSKQHACEFCDMTFSNGKYLRIHMVSHTKERRYPCKYCGVKFGRSDHRLRHQRTVHERIMLSSNI